MYLHSRCRLRSALVLLELWGLLWSGTVFGQQVIQRGALGRPDRVYDETQQWSTPLPMQADKDVELYIPDVTRLEWIKLNYDDFVNKGQYMLTVYTFYKTTKACRESQIGWGYSDAAHLDACLDIGYRVRQALIDVHLKTAALQMAAMVGQDGQIDAGSIQRQFVVRRWVELDANTQTALEKATALVSKQMQIYDTRLQRGR